MSSFAVSFSVISVLTGVFATYAKALAQGGRAGLVGGWIGVALGTMLVAVAMAELASAFPTAGALYHWAAILGGKGWGWLTAMLNLLGQVAIVAAIDLACAEALGGVLGLGRGATFGAFVAILASHAAVNAASIRLVAWLNDASAALHLVGIVVIGVVLVGFGSPLPARSLFDGAGHGARGLVDALVVGMWTMTGFDASAHVSEETEKPELRAPLGIVSAVGVSAIAGLFLVTALALEPKAPAGVTALVVGVMWCCGLSSVTSASRMLFAFARDGGVPGARLLATTSKRLGTPIVAICTATGLPLLLVAATAPFDEEVFLSVATLATTALYASYAVPIGLGAVARARGRWRTMGPWTVGRAGVGVAWGAVVWSAIVIGVCGVADPRSAAMLGGAAIGLGGLWFGGVRGRFSGPRVGLEAIERAR